MLLTLLAIGLIAATGFARPDLSGTMLEDRFYGFFLDRYPLFLFAALYGALSVVIAAVGASERKPWLRVAAGSAATALFVLACFHPTYGGLVVRAGYMSGAMAFVTNQPMPLAYAEGAAAAAAVYGLALAGSRALARLGLSLSRRSLLRSVVSFFALWWGAVVIGSPRILALDATEGWPAARLTGSAALASAALVLLAIAPHALWDRRAER